MMDSLDAARLSISTQINRATERVMDVRLKQYDGVVKNFSKFFNDTDMFRQFEEKAD